MEITYIGHSCFLIKFPSGFSVCFDPYHEGAVPGLSAVNVTADKVFCSHSHRDHSAAGEIGSPDAPYAGSEPEVEVIHTFHDEVEGAKRGNNDITIITCDGLKVVHSGDLGCTLSSEQLEKIKGCDLLMIPVGGFYTIDSEQAFEISEQIGPDIVIPMHYSGDGFGYDEISGRERFVELIKNRSERKVIEGGNVFETGTCTNALLLMEPSRKI